MKLRETLLECARSGELHHAIILHGPAREALQKLAITIAQAQNCVNGRGPDDCSACSRIERRLHPDVHHLELPADRKMIPVEQVRDLLESAVMRPYEGRQKVYIIDPAESLTIQAANSLLKTLEEPTRDTTFLLLTRSPELLLQTIRSRSQALYVGGDSPSSQELADSIRQYLNSFAERQEAAVLLGLALIVASEPDASLSLATLASVLAREAAADTLSIPRQKLLRAADAALLSTRWLVVNADVRLLAEQALSELL